MGEVMNKLTKSVLAAAALATALGGIASPAFAQRDPAYASARATGQVGERMDGYLGIVVAETPALRRIVNSSWREIPGARRQRADAHFGRSPARPALSLTLRPDRRLGGFVSAGGPCCPACFDFPDLGCTARAGPC